MGKKLKRTELKFILTIGKADVTVIIKLKS